MRQGGPAAAAREKGGWKSRGGNLGLSRSPSNRYPTMGEAMNEGVLGQIAARLRPRAPTPAEGAPVEYPIAVRQTQTTPDNTLTAYSKPPLSEGPPRPVPPLRLRPFRGSAGVRGGVWAPESVTLASGRAEGAALVRARGTRRERLGARDRWVLFQPRRGWLRGQLTRAVVPAQRPSQTL